MLTNETKSLLLRRLPKVELSYCKIINRKVSADFYMLIPKGPKGLLWFTYINNKNVCLLLTLNYKGKVNTIEKCTMSFENNMSYGTVVYGTHIVRNKVKHFCCENIHYYKGDNVERYSNHDKFVLFDKMFSQDILQHVHGTIFLIPWVPVIGSNISMLKQVIPELPYSVYGIKYMNKNNSFSIGVEKIKLEVYVEATFKVTACASADLYNLYSEGDNLYGRAMVRSYKKSVFMNNLFRKIKENTNLDLLEESDDEEEFENTSENKFVDMERTLLMKCVYIKRFNKWEPLRVLHSNEEVDTKIAITELEKKVL
jgi:hypothetical protein